MDIKENLARELCYLDGNDWEGYDITIPIKQIYLDKVGNIILAIPALKALLKIYEFEVGYAKRSNVSVEWLHENGLFPVPCKCGEEGCKGFQMIHVNEYSYAPTGLEDIIKQA
ncbi:MAG: hypothetical protein Q8P44_07090, partial [Dehalococcoidia bacterium]|nr:hypothetical protein [Dehalococcoidia bacterium]